MGNRKYLTEEELSAGRHGATQPEPDGPSAPSGAAGVDHGVDRTASVVKGAPCEVAADRIREDAATSGIPEAELQRIVAEPYEHSLLFEMDAGCRRHLEAILPERLDRLEPAQRSAVMAMLSRNGRYDVGKFLAKGAESILYHAQAQGYSFCVKAVRNWLDAWIGRSATRGNQGKLAGVSYNTKVRHITNEYNIGCLLNERNPFTQCPVRILSLRRVRRFGLELGWDLLMERINGIDLGDRALLHSMTLHDKLKVCMQICRAIGGLHQRRLVHLDIKPSNFMLERGGRVRLIDFGISVPAGFRSKTIAGTAGFFSPEQVCRGVLNEDTDIFALGVTFAIIFGGKMLMQNADDVLKKGNRKTAASAMDTCDMPAVTDIPELTAHKEIADVIRNCTIYKRSVRISSCLVLAARLKAAAAKSGFEL